MSFMRMFAAALVLSASVAGVACQAQDSKGEEKKAEQPAKAAPTVYKVGIDGATGASGGPAVVKTLSSLDGVEKAAWDKKKQEATVTMKEGKTLEKEKVVKAFEDSNYEVRSFKKEGEEEKKEEEKKEGEKKEGEGK